MGTRNLTCVYKDGEYKVAQYGQFDGYPSGQGKKILSFLHGEPTIDSVDHDTNNPIYGIDGVIYNKDKFLESLDKCSKATSYEIKKMWDDAGAGGSKWISIEVSNRMRYIHPQMEREMGALILPYIQIKGGIKLKNEIKFVANSLDCEWAYVVDYDKNTFEVYKGFVKEPHNGRFAEYANITNDNESYPVILIKSWDLNDLPIEEEFLKLEG